MLLDGRYEHTSKNPLRAGNSLLASVSGLFEADKDRERADPAGKEKILRVALSFNGRCVWASPIIGCMGSFPLFVTEYALPIVMHHSTLSGKSDTRNCGNPTKISYLTRSALQMGVTHSDSKCPVQKVK